MPFFVLSSEKTFLLPANQIETFCYSSNAERKKSCIPSTILYRLANFHPDWSFISENPIHPSVNSTRWVLLLVSGRSVSTLAQNSTQLCNGIGANLLENSTFFSRHHHHQRDVTRRWGAFLDFSIFFARWIRRVLSSSLSVFKCTFVSV